MDKRFNIEYLPAAEQDITDIVEYIMLDDPAAAFSMLERFDTAVENLSLFPFSGVVLNDIRLRSLNYRMLIVDNYLVFYVVLAEIVEIRRVFHGKRRYNFLFE